VILTARHLRHSLQVHSVSTLVFYISPFSAVLESTSTGPIVAAINGETLEVLHHQYLRMYPSQRHRLLRIEPGGQQSSQGGYVTAGVL